jgi:hypothetical protein
MANEAAAGNPSPTDDRRDLRPVELSSEPPGAQVIDEHGVTLGVTPLVVMVPVDEQRVVTLHRRGYVDQTATLDTGIPRRTVELHRR